MFLFATGLPPNTGFDFFAIQLPNLPFGLSWYQGDVNTDDDGNAFQHFRGRFSGEHNVGIQVLNTSNFPDDKGPLRHLKP
jgi:hypothetical protein